MEEDYQLQQQQQKMKHVCKFCRKSFPCGRSLGGHMRSHMINDVSAQTDGTLITRKKLPSLILTANAENASASAQIIVEKLCKECGKGGFQSWKALFDHMKFHHSSFDQKAKEEDEMEDDEDEDEDEDSWENSGSNMKQKMVIMDSSQSDNEIMTGMTMPNRKKRSMNKRRSAANSSSFSAVSGVEEQEQEEVALCLMLLSRDVTNWGSNSAHKDHNGPFAAAESSDNNYVLSESPPNRLDQEELVKGTIVVVMKSEISVSENPRKSGDVVKRKRKLKECEDQSLEVCKDGNIKFECNTCNKSFHSYQALGGHRASHKKTKGYSASILDETNNAEEEEQEEEETDQKMIMMKSVNNEILDQNKSPTPPSPPAAAAAAIAANRNVASGSVGRKRDVNRSHECPICLKVFPSGQALGGHKRSHLVATNNSKVAVLPTAEVVVPAAEAAKIPVIKDFLDLNLPAPVDEESTNNNNSSINVGFNQWWAGNSHKHEQQQPLVGLISNL